MDRIEIKSLAVVACVALSACATQEARVGREAVESLPHGKVAIVVSYREPALTIKAHDSQRSIGRTNNSETAKAVLGGAALGAVYPAALLGMAAGPIGAAIGLQLAPIGALVGASVGMSRARPAAPMQIQSEPSAEDALALSEPAARALQARPLPQAVAMRVAALAETLPHYSVTYMTESAAATRTDPPEYRELRAAGFASIVEVEMTAIETRVISGPPMEATLAASFRVRLLSQESVQTMELEGRGFSHSREVWTDAAGRQLQEDMEAVVEQIALQVLAQSFDQSAAE